MTVRTQAPPGTRILAAARPPLVVGAVLAAGTLLVALRDPHHGGYPICPVLALTGMACAGCGGLRAAHDLVTGDLAGAWAMNPLLTVAMPVAAVLWLLWLIRSARGLPAWQPPAWLWIATAVAVLAFSILRNVPALHGALGPG
jgi:hypothetical protein